MGHTLFRSAWKSHAIKAIRYLKLDTAENLQKVNSLKKAQKWLYKILDLIIKKDRSLGTNQIFYVLIEHGDDLKNIYHLISLYYEFNARVHASIRGEILIGDILTIFHHAAIAEIACNVYRSLDVKVVECTSWSGDGFYSKIKIEHDGIRQIQLNTIALAPEHAELISNILRLFNVEFRTDDNYRRLLALNNFDQNLLKSVVRNALFRHLKEIIPQRDLLRFRKDYDDANSYGCENACASGARIFLKGLAALLFLSPLLLILVGMPVVETIYFPSALLYSLAKGRALLFLDKYNSITFETWRTSKRIVGEFREDILRSRSFRKLDIFLPGVFLDFLEINKFDKLDNHEKKYLNSLSFLEQHDFDEIINEYNKLYKESQQDAASKAIQRFFHQHYSSVEEIENEILEYADLRP